jgi:hypothetical protein
MVTSDVIMFIQNLVKIVPLVQTLNGGHTHAHRLQSVT